MTPATLRRQRTTQTSPTRFPTTRYQGSKRKLADSILCALRDLEFTTVLDAFGGTGAVAHAFKRAGQAVTYNDLLAFNHQIGLALIENDVVLLSSEEIGRIGVRQPGHRYDDLIERTFDGIYFTAAENRWLDVAVGNLRRIPCIYERALAGYALFQSAMAKRPYNLFHRRNLYMRTADVRRSFGNKTTWDRSFTDHFAAFAAEANQAVIDSDGRSRALCLDALEIEPGFDLVYIDPPYLNHAGIGVDYHHFYHFLEGLVCYDDWEKWIDFSSKHRRLTRRNNPWTDRTRVHQQFVKLFDRFRDSILVVSYRSDGIPSNEELTGMLSDVKRQVRLIDGPTYQYALSTNRHSREVLLVGID